MKPRGHQRFEDSSEDTSQSDSSQRQAAGGLPFTENPGLLSFWTFSYAWPLVATAKKGTISYEECTPLLQIDNTETNRERFQSSLEWHARECASSHRPFNAWAIWRALMGTYWRDLIPSVGCRIVGDTLGYLPPLFLAAMVEWLSLRNSDISVAQEEPAKESGAITAGAISMFGMDNAGLFLALGMFLCDALSSVIVHQHHAQVIRIGMRARLATGSIVHSRCLKLPSFAAAELGDGKLLNMISSDAESVEYVFWMIHYIWSSPLQIIIIMFLLQSFTGPVPAFAGFLALCALITFQTRTTKVLHRLRAAVQGANDSRLKAVGDALKDAVGIKAIGLEQKASSRAVEARGQQQTHLVSWARASALVTSVMNAGTILVSAVCFTALTFTDSDSLRSGVVFTTLALLDKLRLPLMTLPSLVGLLTSAHVAFGRISNMFEAGVHKDVDSDEQSETAVALSAQKVSFSPNGKAVLNGIEDLKIPVGSVVYVTGAVGSGKTLLLQAIAGEACLGSPGILHRSGKAVLCTQTPIIFRGSVQDNVRLGRDLTSRSGVLQQALEVSALETDVELWEDGLDHDVGEGGSALSGGQKARISLCRALVTLKLLSKKGHSSKDILLLDDVFAALDAITMKRVINSLVVSPTFREGCTTFIVSARGLPCHASHIHQHVHIDDSRGTISVSKYDAESSDNSDSDNGVEDKSTDSGSNDSPISDEGIVTIEKSQSKVEDEDAGQGIVGISVLLNYAQIAGLVACGCILFACLLLVTLENSASIWLETWTSNFQNTTPESARRSLLIYVLLGIGAAFTGAMVTVQCARHGIKVSSALHNASLNRIVAATPAWLRNMPSGRLLNRLGADVQVTDMTLWTSIASLLVQIGRLFSRLVVMVFYLWPMLFVLMPLSILYYYIQQLYTTSTSAIRRLQNVSRSPAYTAAQETISGAVVWRNLDVEEGRRSMFESTMDRWGSAWWRGHLINRWLGLRLEVMGSAVMGSCAMLIATSNSVSPSVAGLILSIGVSLTQLLNWTVRQVTDVATALTSVERIQELASNAPVEGGDTIPAPATRTLALTSQERLWGGAAWLRPSAVQGSGLFEQGNISDDLIFSNSDWPRRGQIEFKQLSLRYRPDMPWALNQLTLSVSAGSSLGIAGRTGSGKSTTIQALLRLIPLDDSHSQGSVFVDGHDIRNVTLSKLRSCMAVVPQQPILFVGTLRFNLDPLGDRPDSFLSQILSEVGLGSWLESLPKGLDEHMERADNISVGQSQLICLARATIRSCKIAILDEAEAALDEQAAADLWAAAKRTLSNVTLIAVAHRVSALQGMDCVAVLDKGELAEMGPPSTLMRDESSRFAAMVKAAAH